MQCLEVPANHQRAAAEFKDSAYASSLVMMAELRQQRQQHPSHCSQRIPHLRTPRFSLCVIFCVAVDGVVIMVVA